MEFDHIAFTTEDVGASVRWIQDVLPGAQVRYQDATWALIDAAGVRIAFVRPEQHPAHAGFRVTRDELGTLARRHGAEIAPHRDGSESFYLEGPGGLWVELVAYPDQGGGG